MKKRLQTLYDLMVIFGFDPRKTIRSFRGLPAYFTDLLELKGQKWSATSEFPFGKYFPCLEERFVESGVATGHYFHQDLLVARRVFLNNPTIHADIGSSIYGFVSHVASFRSIIVFDIRPLAICIPNVEFFRSDMMGTIKDDLVNYCDSISCLHALEHFGLGRYGDPVRHDGHLIGLNNLHKMLKVGGKSYISVPIGPQRIEFNAHRVFSVKYLLDCFSDKYNIDRFSFVDDKGDLHENVFLNEVDTQNNFGCSYGCGIFEMTKL